MTHPCPFEAGELLALGAIASTSRTPGGRALSERCFEHARQHADETPKDVAEDE